MKIIFRRKGILSYHSEKCLKNGKVVQNSKEICFGSGAIVLLIIVIIAIIVIVL